jgi:hypothetical protein
MIAIPFRGGDQGCDREAFVGGVWVYFHYLELVAELLAQGRNVWIASETNGLRAESASELEAVVEFWTWTDADVTRH